MKVNANFLVLPAVIGSVTLAFASVALLPFNWGVPLALLLALGVLTAASLVHPRLDNEMVLHLMLYIVCLCAAYFFACWAIPQEFGPQLYHDLNWSQLGFVVVQQMCYFGVHAFTDE